MKTSALIAALLASATLSTTTLAQQAQPWLANRRYGEGIGIRAGDLELHPGAGVELGYDSNYTLRANTQREPEIASVILRPSAWLTLSTLGPQRRAFDGGGAERPKVSFDGTISASYYEFLWANREAESMRKLRNLAANASAKLDILPQAPWGGDLLASFQRMIQPSNEPVLQSTFNRDTIRLGAGVIWRPGGGLFDWRLGYEFVYNYFEAATFENLSNTQHYVKTRGRWRFLPRTALLYDAELGFIYYGANQPLLNDSTPIRSRVGLNGLITQRLALLAMIGWGASFYQQTHVPIQDYDSLIAQAELTWYVIAQPQLPSDAASVGLSAISVGYTRDFTNSYMTSYYQRDRGYLKMSYLVAGRLLFLVDGGFGHLTYPPAYYANGALRYPPSGDKWGENRVDAQAFAEYRIGDTVGINTTFRYDANLTTTGMPTQENPPPGIEAIDYLQFKRFQIFLGARWFM